MTLLNARILVPATLDVMMDVPALMQVWNLNFYEQLMGTIEKLL